MFKYFLLCLSIIASQFLEAKIYKWVDKNGQVHYSDKPFNENSEEVKFSSQPTLEQQQEAAQTARKLLKRNHKYQMIQHEDAQDKYKKKRQENKKKKACQDAEKELAILKMQVRVFHTDKDGSRIFLNDSQRKKEIDYLQDNILKHCRP